MDHLLQIRNERAEIARQRAALDKRDAELAVAEKVVAGFEGSAPATPPPEIPFAFGAAAPATTRRERVIEALSGESLWMTSAEINKAISKRHGVLIKGTSLYPMLSLLKSERVIVRKGDRMALRGRIGEGSQVND